MYLFNSSFDIRTPKVHMLQIVDMSLKSFLIFRFFLYPFYFPILKIFLLEMRSLLEGQWFIV